MITQLLFTLLLFTSQPASHRTVTSLQCYRTSPDCHPATVTDYNSPTTVHLTSPCYYNSPADAQSPDCLLADCSAPPDESPTLRCPLPPAHPPPPPSPCSPVPPPPDLCCLLPAGLLLYLIIYYLLLLLLLTWLIIIIFMILLSYLLDHLLVTYPHHDSYDDL